MQIFSRMFAASLSLMMICGLAAAQNDEVKKLNDELASLYAKGNYDQALQVADQLVGITEKKYGVNDVAVAKAIKNRAMVEDAKGDSSRAAGSFKDAIAIFKKHPDLSKADGSSYAETVEFLGQIRMKQGMDLGRPVLEDALKLREKYDGPDAPATAAPLALLGNIAFWARDYKKSAELYRRSFNILAKNSGSAGNDLTTVYYRAQCSFRKAKIENDFADLKTLYESSTSDSGPIVRRRASVTGIVNGKAIKLEKPMYPREAAVSRAEGKVRVELLLSEKGDPISACAVADTNSSPALIEAAEAAALRSKFQPTTLNGDPVKVFGLVEYSFNRR